MQLDTNGDIFPYMQNFSDDTHEEFSLSVVIVNKDKEVELEKQVLSLAKKHNVEFDLYLEKNDKQVDQLIRGEMYDNIVESKNISITEVIIKLIDKYKLSPIEINKGFCEDFADDINRIIKESQVVDDGFFWISGKPKYYNEFKASFLKIRGMDEYYDLEVMNNYNSTPSDDIKNVLLNNEILGHSWIYYNNKHYDAESPEGVESFWDLPFFIRWIKLKTK